MRNIKLLIPLIALLILIPSILALDEGLSFGDRVIVTVTRAQHNNTYILVDQSISVNNNLKVEKTEAIISSSPQISSSSEIIQQETTEKKSWIPLIILIVLAYFLFFAENKPNLKIILIILAISIAYLILINIAAQLSILEPEINETKITGAEIIGISDIVQVTVNRQRWWGNIIEENGDSKAYIFKIIPLPLKYDNISFIKFHIAFLIFIAIFYYLKAKKKPQEISNEVNQNNELPSPNLQTFVVENGNCQDINKNKDITRNPV